MGYSRTGGISFQFVVKKDGILFEGTLEDVHVQTGIEVE